MNEYMLLETSVSFLVCFLLFLAGFVLLLILKDKDE